MSIKYTSRNVIADGAARHGASSRHASGKAVEAEVGKRVAAGALVCLLGLGLVAPYPVTQAIAEETTQEASSSDASGSADATSTSSAAKGEVVYVKTDASGNATGVYVVNSFNTPTATQVTDPGTYTSVQNLSTTEQLSNENGETSFTTTAGQPFYYQGDLDASTTLPWKVSITYTLDGKEVSPDELAGKSGELDIALSITGLDDGSATADFAQEFLVQAQGTFPADNFEIEDGGGTMLASVGSNSVVTCIALPGHDATYHIKGNAKDFTSSGWQISALPLDISSTTAENPELADLVDQLEDDTSSLASGSSELTDALGQISSGSSSLASGASSLKAGTSQLSSGASTLRDSLAAQDGDLLTLKSGSSQVAAGVTTLSDALGGLSSTMADAQASLTNMQASVSDIQSDLDQLGRAMQGMGTTGQQTVADINTASSDLGTLASTLGSLQQTLTDAGTAAGTAQAYAQGASKAATTAQGYADTASTQASNANAAIQALVSDGTLTQEQAQSALDASSAAAQAAGGASQAAAQAASAADTAGTQAGTALSDIQGLGTALQGFDQQKLTDELTAVQTDLNTLSTQAQAMMQGANATTQKAQGTLTSAQQLMNGMGSELGTLQSQMGQLGALQSGSQQVAAGTATLVDSLTTTGTSANGQPTLRSALNSVASGAAALDSGAGSLASGAGELASGASQAQSGSQTLSDALNEVNDLVTDKLGSSYTLHSFVDPDNTDVSQVQFVYVVSGVSTDDSGSGDAKAADESDSKSDSESDSKSESSSSSNFIERLVSLFDKKQDK